MNTLGKNPPNKQLTKVQSKSILNGQLTCHDKRTKDSHRIQLEYKRWMASAPKSGKQQNCLRTLLAHCVTFLNQSGSVYNASGRLRERPTTLTKYNMSFVHAFCHIMCILYPLLVLFSIGLLLDSLLDCYWPMY